IDNEKSVKIPLGGHFKMSIKDCSVTDNVVERTSKVSEVLEAKTVKVLNVGTRHNVADALTNVVPELKLQHFLELLNVGLG
nr:hypothetical protein [Tanacetum cinerariifolium]